MKKSTKILAVFVTVLTVACIITTASYTKVFAYSTNILENVGELLLLSPSSSGGLNTLSRLDGEFVSTHISEDGSYESISTGIKDNDTLYAAGTDKFYFLNEYEDMQNDTALHYACLTTLNCEDGYAYTKAFNNLESNMIRSFAVDGSGSLYIANERGVRIYSPSLKYQDTIIIDRQPHYLTASQDGNQIFAVYGGLVGIIENYNINLFSIDCDKVYPCNSYLATDTGEVYEYNQNELTYVLTQDCSLGVGSSDGMILGCKDGDVTVFEENIDAPVTYESPTAITSMEKSCLCLFQSGNNIKIQLVFPEELAKAVEQRRIEIDAENQSHGTVTSRNNNNQGTSSNQNNQSAKIEYYYRSHTLSFNESTKTLTGVKPSSTIAEIKSAISYSGYSLSFTDHNGNSKTGGNIGTGGKITFKGNGKTVSFTIIIFGDVTGEGNINSSDKNALYNHLLGSKTLDGVYLTAADYTRDGKVDLADLVAVSDAV